MKRRDFITLLGGTAAAWPVAAGAQQAGRMKRIGYVSGRDEDSVALAYLSALRQGLVARGWIEGRNIEITARYGAADPDRNRAYVAELLRLMPDVVVTANGGTAHALKEAPALAIVMPQMSDPIASGWAESLARPGGSLTGFVNFEPSIATKWLELLREIAPVYRVAILIDPLPETSANIYVRAVELAAASLGIPVTAASVRDEADIEQTVASFARTPHGGLIVPAGPWFANRSALIIGSATRHRLPVAYALSSYVVDGGLISYSPDLLDHYRRSASYVDRILKGAKPADLPIQLPTRYELVVNLKAAKAIGLTISESFLVRADQVIE